MAPTDSWLTELGEDQETPRTPPPISGTATEFPLRPLVANSWVRSEAAGASPDRGILPPVPLEGPELASYRDAHPLHAAILTCQDLLGLSIRESGWVFAVTDANGVLLWVDGDQMTRRRISRVNFIEGALWSETGAGTNAPGTVLATGQPVQIIGREHYNEAVRDWSCVAAPLRDPDSGCIVGVLDITGGPDIAHPQVLALARATACAMEARLAQRMSEADVRARDAFQRKAPAGAAALVSSGGRILDANNQRALAELAARARSGNGTDLLLDDRRLVLEPAGVNGYTVVRFVEAADPPGDAEQIVRVSALGVDNATVEIAGREVKLSPRHSEIVVLLALAEDGLSAGELAADLLRDEQNTLAIRVDMSRLRAVLGKDLLASRPYRLLKPARCDVHVVRDLLAAGRVRDALRVYPGPLLPLSDAPSIVEHRLQLEHRLRSAVLTSGDAWLLQRWVDAPWGSQDLHAWETLARVLPSGTPQQATVTMRADALRTSYLPPRRS